MSTPFLLKDIFSGFGGSNPSDLTAVGNTLYFTANNGVNGYGLWKSDGTTAGTVLVKIINPSSFIRDLTTVGNTLYFRTNDGVNGEELWKSDGTAAGTVLVKNINAGVGSSTPRKLTAVGNTLYFRANDGINGYELWKSDSTAAGTVLIDIVAGASTYPRELTALGNTLYFTANDGVNGEELWKSDGTTAGTVLIDIVAGAGSSFPRNLTVVGNTLYFIAEGGVLWKSNGTAAGTVPVKNNISLTFPTAVGNTLYFIGNDAINGPELWKSDGTAAGTFIVKDINTGLSGSNPRYLTAVGNTLYFIANNGVNGDELWKSDGTTSGTVLVKDIRTGVSTSFARELTAVGNTLYFIANDGVNGEEFWKSDGTAAGTVMVRDVRTGPYGSTPRELTAVGNALYFVADNGVNGLELWLASTVISATSANQTEGNSGGKAFTFTVTRAGDTTVSNSFNWAVTGTGTNPANGDDFVGGVLPSGTVSFAAGEITKVITINVQGDTTIEPNETFRVTLTNPANSPPIAPAQGTIKNDDSAVATNLAIAVTNANQPEGNSGSKAFTFTVTRSGSTTGANNVNWAVTGTGTNPANATDFVGGILPSGVVSFVTGETSKVITINVQGDTAIELDETFTVTLSNPTNGATLTTAIAQGTIQNDDTSSGNTFTGTTGNDILNGTTGADTLIGLAGNDTYTVNNSGDVVTENLNEGTDTVKSDITYTLGNNLENLTLNGSSNLNGTGNALNNTLTGNTGANILTGLAGNDIIDGKVGVDTMIGGLGNDTYTVDNIGDVVTENLNEGTDTVKTSITYILGNNLENLTLTGSTNLNGTGNALNNKLVGNTGVNTLNGGAGLDTLTGGSAADIFVFRFGESTVTALDRVNDFTIGSDKIDLLTQGGAAMSAPIGFTRAADSVATVVSTIVNNLFVDANGGIAGNQALGVNRAALVKANTATYLIVNDGVGGFQSANDLVINLTGITGTLPALGSIPVSGFFLT